jgi:hypothetical protein
MAAKLLLCVSAHQATAAIWRQGRLGSIQTFDISQAGLGAFDAYLRSARGVPVRVMVDTIDEDYRFETLPHVARSDRASMAQRRMRQLYRSTPFAAWQQQERVVGKRKDDRYLFAAITDPEILSPWIRVIEACRAPISGIYPLPMVTLGLIPRLVLRHTNLLIVTRNGAGLRQTFCKHLRFRISRLTAPREPGTPADTYFAEEIGNTRMYLDALTVTHVDDTVHVLILDHDNSLVGLPAALSRGRPNMHCELLGPDEIARKLSVPPADLAGSADALHLHLLASGTPHLDLAPPQVEVGFQVYKVRQYVYAGAAALALGAVIWAAVNEIRAWNVADQIVTLEQQIQQYQRRYKEMTAQFPQTPASAEELRDTVEAAQRIRGALRTPERMLVVVSRALDASPDIALRKVDWRYATLAEPAGDTAAQSSKAPARNEPRQVGVIAGEVTRDAQDPRAVLDRIRGFTASLAANRQVEEVRVLRLPMDVTSSSALSGTTAEVARSPQAQFEVAVIFRAGA